MLIPFNNFNIKLNEITSKLEILYQMKFGKLLKIADFNEKILLIKFNFNKLSFK